MEQTKFQPVIQRFKLNNSTCEKLKNLTPNFGFNGLGELVFRRTYSRNNEDWADVVIRVIQGCLSIRKEHFYRSSLLWDDEKWQTFASDMALSLFHMEWLPPGRGLWMMGTEFTYERGSMSLNNCFQVQTKFWTSEGLKSFSDFKDGDIVVVRGKNKWVPATVKCFGKAPLWKLTVGKSGIQNTIFVTANHRWIAKTKKGDGNKVYNWKIKTTEELEVNWKLHSFAKRTNFHAMEICSIGIQHGIVFGDGTTHKETNNCAIQLCGDKKELSRYFFTPRKNNSTITGLPNTWKTLPSLTMNKEYLFGFLAGWFATDGSIDKASGMTISNSDQNVLQWARNALFILDITTSDIKLSRTLSPYDGSYKPCYSLRINREQVPEQFFLRDEQIERFKPSTTYPDWRVIDVEPTERIEEVWCVVEPELEEFTLENGILTKNCSATDTEDDFVHSAEWTMDGLMNGVGVGFTTNWRGEATMPDKSDSEIFVIPDSREGWVQSLIKLMCSYINSPRYGKNKFPIFDYSQIRVHGEPIKGFGGTASGFDPLKQMHERIESYLDAFCIGRLQCTSKTWKEFKSEDLEQATSEWREVDVEVDKPYSHTRLVADVFNAIGACVVAGNVRRCLPGDALVHTKGGLIPIKDVEIGQEALTFNGYQKITNKFVQGVQKLVKIITQDGDFRCTPNHRVAIATSYSDYTWKMASELVKGDRLIGARDFIEGQETSLPEWSYEKPSSHSTTCKDIIIPELDADMAWFVGLFHADGYTYPNYDKNGFNAYVSLVFGLDEMDIAEKAREQLERFGENLNVTLKKRKDENSLMVHCQSKQLAWYFDKNVKQANTEIRVPEFILKARHHVKLAYVAGVTDGDGCTGHRPIIVVSTVYEKFARDLQNVLYSCGIESRLNICTTQNPSRKDNWQKVHKLTLITKRSQTQFSEIPELLKDLRSNSKSQNANGFPSSFETTPKVKTLYGLYGNKQFNIDAYAKQYGECSFTPIEVVEVVEDVEEETYDIEVENRHEFFCNGIICHNSAEISLGYVDDKDFMNLKNYELNPERSAIGWLSNNSVVLRADRGYEDFSYIPDMARRIRDNGEPGMINLYNIQKYGRFGKELPDEATLVNPCGEICLENFELCNLAEVFPPRCSDPQKFYKALEYATLYASTVSLLPTHRPETNAVIAKNRRIGVSISGIAQWASKSDSEEWGQMNYTKMISFLRHGYKVVRETNTRLSKEAGVPAAVRVTTVKPSGSISLLAGATPGVHYPVSRYAIRRVRIGMTSPLVEPLIAAGVPHEKDIVSENTYVFEFVIDHGDVRPCEEVSPWEQFSVVQMMQKHYADNCVSATIYFDKEKDGPDVEKMLAMFIPNLKSVSMLPHSGHGYQQPPYEPITFEQYEKRKNQFKPINYKSVKNNVPAGSKFCSGDTCEL
jgi:intein/homing endonuclease